MVCCSHGFQYPNPSAIPMISDAQLPYSVAVIPHAPPLMLFPMVSDAMEEVE
uniref:Uncharacterized protein n=1 Tax=Anguilla anguilla TaxID=7936 RepID=A0A0E9WDE1_ANGAN